MYMCGRLRTASRPSRTLMLSAEYSPPAGAPLAGPRGSAGRFSRAVSNHPPRNSGGLRRRWSRREDAAKIGLKYHARSRSVKAIGRLQRGGIQAVLRCVRTLYPAFADGVENRRRSLWSSTRRGCDQVRVGGREDHLSLQLAEVPHEIGVALRIQLAGDVIEQEQRRAAVHAAQVLDLADLERQHGGASLTLAGEEARRPLPERQ